MADIDLNVLRRVPPGYIQKQRLTVRAKSKTNHAKCRALESKNERPATALSQEYSPDHFSFFYKSDTYLFLTRD